MRNLKTVLENDYGLDLTGWTLTEARGINADGTVIVGYGISTNGTEAWMATIDPLGGGVIPEATPALMQLLALILGSGLGWIKRRIRSCKF